MDRRRATADATRLRITAAAFELHATVGPSRTTIQAIADAAGVQRHTVYAHFPDLDSLFRACTQHGIEVTGMPEPGPWLAIEDPGERLRLGLLDLFSWYRANERMLRNVLHDVDPTAAAPTEPDLFEIRMGRLFDALATSWYRPDGDLGPTLSAVLTLAMAFETWVTLTGAGMTDEQAVRTLTSILQTVDDDA